MAGLFPYLSLLSLSLLAAIFPLVCFCLFLLFPTPVRACLQQKGDLEGGRIVRGGGVSRTAENTGAENLFAEHQPETAELFQKKSQKVKDLGMGGQGNLVYTCKSNHLAAVSVKTGWLPLQFLNRNNTVFQQHNLLSGKLIVGY